MIYSLHLFMSKIRNPSEQGNLADSHGNPLWWPNHLQVVNSSFSVHPNQTCLQNRPPLGALLLKRPACLRQFKFKKLNLTLWFSLLLRRERGRGHVQPIQVWATKPYLWVFFPLFFWGWCKIRGVHSSGTQTKWDFGSGIRNFGSAKQWTESEPKYSGNRNSGTRKFRFRFLVANNPFFLKFFS